MNRSNLLSLSTAALGYAAAALVGVLIAVAARAHDAAQTSGAQIYARAAGILDTHILEAPKDLPKDLDTHQHLRLPPVWSVKEVGVQGLGSAAIAAADPCAFRSVVARTFPTA